MAITKKNKTILITGCSQGIGFHLAINLAKRGFKVYSTVKSLSTSLKLISKSKNIPNLIVRQMNVTNNIEIGKVKNEIIKNNKSLDVLINNAGYVLFGPIESISISEAQEQFNVNFFGVLRTINAFLPYMRKNKKGHIINMGSTSGVHVSPMYGLYSASKFALEALSYSLYCNLYPWNIKVTIIENSGTKTNIHKKSLKIGSNFKSKKNPYKKYIKNSLKFLKHIINNGENPKDIAEKIINLINNPTKALRSFPTKKALNTLKNILKDPHGGKIITEAKEEYNQFYK